MDASHSIVTFQAPPQQQQQPRPVSPFDENQKILFLIRGLPGTGKTTKAK